MPCAALALLLTLCALHAQAPNPNPAPGAAAHAAFTIWHKQPAHQSLSWEAALAQYKIKLLANGLSPAETERTLSLIASWDEGAFYDPVYTAAQPKHPTAPTPLLIEAVRNRPPGRALDVAMGQGRNSLYLARRGWDVTGFDTSRAGIERARKAATAAGLKLRALLSSDEEFDFGVSQWDLIAILYPIEKRSIHRVRQALKPGGIIVVECGHKEGSNAPFEYSTGELLELFKGFRILKYEDAVAPHEWAGKPLRMVKLIAQK